MIDWLQKQGDYTANGLTKVERADLESLRREVRRYREIDELNEKNKVESKSPEVSVYLKLLMCDQDDEDEEDEEGDTVPDTVFEKSASKNKTPFRSSVSAEVYGQFNKKGNFKPRVIPKSESQIQRIKTRILTSFLFCNLDAEPLNVVINAMEEMHYKLVSYSLYY